MRIGHFSHGRARPAAAAVRCDRAGRKGHHPGTREYADVDRRQAGSWVGALGAAIAARCCSIRIFAVAGRRSTCLPGRVCGLILTLEGAPHRGKRRAAVSLARSPIGAWKKYPRDRWRWPSRCWAWYRPDGGWPPVNEHQKKFVREIGAECARHDIPYVLELLVYSFPSEAPPNHHRRLCGIARAKLPFAGDRKACAEFAKTGNTRVDLLKLESPLAANSLPARRRRRGGPGPRKREFRRDRAWSVGSRRIPWLLLSGGRRAGQVRAGAGLRLCRRRPAAFLAGRTIWLDAVRRAIFRTRRRSPTGLRKDGVAVLESLSDLTTTAKAKAWTAHYLTQASATSSRKGDFARAY